MRVISATAWADRETLNLPVRNRVIAAKLAKADIYTSDDVENFARAWFNRAGHGAPGNFHGVGHVLGSSPL